jgi:hypothetical protein
MNCGQMLHSVQAPPAGAGAPVVQTVTPQQVEADRRKKIMLGSAAGVLVLLALVFGLRAVGALQFGASRPDSEVLRAEGTAPQGDLLRAQGAPPLPPPVLQAEGTPADKRQMPPHVRAWLEHLERIERRKNELHSDQVTELSAQMSVFRSTSGIMTPDQVLQMTDPDSELVNPLADSLNKIIAKMDQPWAQLRQEYVSMAPPDEVKELAQAYDEGLVGVRHNMQRLKDLVNSINLLSPEFEQQRDQAVQGARDVRATHRRSVDQAFKDSDSLLGKVCSYFNERKWFSIQSDVSAGGFLR